MSEKKTQTLSVTATEPQAEFLQLDCRYPLFVGGYGSGKTETLINCAIIDASHAPDALIALYAPTYDLVKLILAARLEAKLQEYDIEYDYNKSENIIRTRHPQFGNFVLRSLDSPERIVGYQSYRAHIDELDVLPLKQAEMAWNKIIGRNRQVPKGMTQENTLNRVNAYSTPEGYNFLYKRWVKDNPNPKEYRLVKAKSRSNPFLPESYIESLEMTYSGELVKAYLEGDFVNLVSGTIYYGFSRSTNSSKEVVQPHEPLYVGMDFNVGKQCATVFVKRGDQWHAVDELSDMLDTPATIEALKERYGDADQRQIYIYPDASGASRKTVGASETDISLLKQAGYIVRVNRTNPKVKDRILAANTAFNAKKVFVNVDRCPNTTECLEQQAYDENGQPDKKSGKDHQNDATTYFIAYELPVKSHRGFQIETSYYNKRK